MVENPIVWHKVLPTYREVGVVYILIKTGKPYMVGKAVWGDIGVQVCVTNGVTSVLWNKICKRVQTKNGQNTALHALT